MQKNTGSILTISTMCVQKYPAVFRFSAFADILQISRESIDAIVRLWGEELSQADRQLIVKLKGIFKIQ